MHPKSCRFSALFAGFAILAACKQDPAKETGEPTTSEPTPTETSSPETGEPFAWDCVIDEKEPNYSPQVGCEDDFHILASDPLDASIPGAQSVKTVVDRIQKDLLYFQNSKLYPIHWDFCFANLSGNGLPIVPDLGSFNSTEYYSPDRRFILGAVTYYEEPDKWVYEIAPYDSATADLIATAFYEIRDNSYFGGDLFFHPSSEAIEAEAENLPDDIPIITTDELFEGITYQPLNLGTTMGQLTFYEDVEDELPWYREVVVLDGVPNDISIVAGIITSDFQTPLSHINVLSQNRGTPNMALIDGFDDPVLRDLEGKWVELTVDAFDWTIREVSQAEADLWWEENKPDPLEVTPMDLSVTELTEATDVLDLATYDLGDALTHATPAFGGKASHYGGLVHIGPDVPVPDAFVIPVYYYNQFMVENDFWPRVEAMLADKKFLDDPELRQTTLEQLRDDMMAAPINPDTLAAVIDKMNSYIPGQRCRFRSSTNAEDLSGFNGAGLYTSVSGDPNNEKDYPVNEAMKEVWASVWNFRAYEEREYFSIDHRQIGMALLVHHSFPDEEANGVAITANIYDVTGLEPGFYVNVQEGEESVVFPDAGVTTDQYIHYFYSPGQPIVYIAHSNLVDADETVLTNAESYDLGVALDAIHYYFFEVYGTKGGFYGMDVEFKFDDLDSGGTPTLHVKQARPYPGWGG